MVREVSGDFSARWSEPFKAGKAPEPPSLPPFSKENAHEWMTKLEEFLQWGITNWNDPDVRNKVNDMIDKIMNVYFSGDNYDKSIEILREGFNISKTDERYGILEALVQTMGQYTRIDRDVPDIQKGCLEEIATYVSMFATPK